MTGTDFPCRAVFEIRRPAASLVMVCYDENREEISRTAYAPGELEDYQTFEMDGGVAAVEMIACDADGRGAGNDDPDPGRPQRRDLL